MALTRAVPAQTHLAFAGQRLSSITSTGIISGPSTIATWPSAILFAGTRLAVVKEQPQSRSDPANMLIRNSDFVICEQLGLWL